MPKTPAQRKADERERRKKEGKVLFTKYVWPDMVAKLHAYADKLLRRGKDG